jgi:hypothetical protein
MATPEGKILSSGSKTYWRERMSLEIVIVEFERFNILEVVIMNITALEEVPRVYMDITLVNALLEPDEANRRFAELKEKCVKPTAAEPSMWRDVYADMVAAYVFSKLKFTKCKKGHVNQAILQEVELAKPFELQPFVVEALEEGEHERTGGFYSSDRLWEMGHMRGEKEVEAGVEAEAKEQMGACEQFGEEGETVQPHADTAPVGFLRAGSSSDLGLGGLCQAKQVQVSHVPQVPQVSLPPVTPRVRGIKGMRTYSFKIPSSYSVKMESSVKSQSLGEGGEGGEDQAVKSPSPSDSPALSKSPSMVSLVEIPSLVPVESLGESQAAGKILSQASVKMSRESPASVKVSLLEIPPTKSRAASPAVNIQSPLKVTSPAEISPPTSAKIPGIPPLSKIKMSRAESPLSPSSMSPSLAPLAINIPCIPSVASIDITYLAEFPPSMTPMSRTAKTPMHKTSKNPKTPKTPKTPLPFLKSQSLAGLKSSTGRPPLDKNASLNASLTVVSMKL